MQPVFGSVPTGPSSPGSTKYSSEATDMNLLTRDVPAFPPAIKVSLSNSNFTSSASPVSSAAVFRLTCHLLVGIPYLLSTILLGLIYRDRKKAAQRVRERRRSSKVIMEIAV
ncbi:hypothetical protein EXN66_Car013789 [Channa argus]|uniref:Uncharacterized protein n=1 Tax=Channa argus TaxID=215402 RepID=A0A6G1Q768_CHAAH|nr:hypothetical protein EXN66_Car013789 [Channa argus]